MRILLVPGRTPLSAETKDAWRYSGGVFLRRSRNGIIPRKAAEKADVIINLGSFDLTVPLEDGLDCVWNWPSSIAAVSSPHRFMEVYGGEGLTPVYEGVGAHWHKTLKGKRVFHSSSDCGVVYGAVQKHVDGEEYRIITVGDRIVQASHKTPIENPTSRWHRFHYRWVGVERIRKGGFIPLLKEAVGLISRWERTIIGWDVIHDGGRPWLIEANFCPGVNVPSAGRIVDQIRKEIDNE